MRAPRGIGTLRVLSAALVVSTAIHFTDNAFKIDEYPGTEPGGTIGVPLFWLAFMAAGVAGYRLYVRGREPAAQILLFVFAYAGLASPLHYTSAGGSRLEWWQHVSIATDALTGLAMAGFVIWSLRRRAVRGSPAQARPARSASGGP
jgi:hypothetical protein